MTGEPKPGMQFTWRNTLHQVETVEMSSRGDRTAPPQWYITARRWIKTKDRWSANAGTYRWAGIEGELK